ncbi:sigma-70 family RNA polymerase sigma factor [Modestobacter sp. I12A-02628]|uniref:Sigma-70 family RNA polymerase sigma factor n=1 Tax=Goekera deserti TaxID=2497753 RepID=A0A7K3WFA7_9ACTN|nr:sigma-70 family RNA polymerase sigma factor [Goekera deserti]MPR00040.1 sigma-70 family RNA polymerase sigma factor [Goekera deserti]NDI49819.1 sigma-70 family RNA polymerase sigma factor [Goekera deserti]NEL55181.1 sigma-70 family RNA polymerase sigma factor [Goekera deserti]
MSGMPPVEEQIAALYREHGHRVLGYLARRVQPVEDAADLLSETMLITWRRRADLPVSPHDVPWLFGVARNVLANHRRSTTRRHTATAHLASLLTERTQPSAGGHVDAGLDARRALGQLSEVDREIVTLIAWDGLTSAEVSMVLNLPSATVRTRLARSRRRLRQLMSDYAPEEDPARMV